MDWQQLMRVTEVTFDAWDVYTLKHGRPPASNLIPQSPLRPIAVRLDMQSH